MFMENNDTSILLLKIDWLVDSISNDTTKSQLPELARLLIQLSTIFGNAKREYIRQKVNMSLQEPQIKDKIRQEFDKEQDKFELECTEDEKKKRKRAKLTVDEIDMRLKLNEAYRWLILAKWEQEWIVVYLEPIVKSYYERINSVKFSSREDKEANKVFNQ